MINIVPFTEMHGASTVVARYGRRRRITMVLSAAVLVVSFAALSGAEGPLTMEQVREIALASKDFRGKVIADLETHLVFTR